MFKYFDDLLCEGVRPTKSRDPPNLFALFFFHFRQVDMASRCLKMDSERVEQRNTRPGAGDGIREAESGTFKKGPVQ